MSERNWSKRTICQDAKKGANMLSWSLTFLIFALIAALLGFTGLAGTAVGIAKILFVVFLVMYLLSVVFGRRRI
jgi:uncharacterized membrane protein YtjA (UPF0391 family)